MRPTVYGKEIRVDNNDKCVGINIGYNFYAEHEGDTCSIVENVNNKFYSNLNLLKALGRFKNRQEINKLNKQLKCNEKLISRWNNTPFVGHVFFSTTPFWLKMIVINNSEVRKKYNNVILEDGHYYLLVIGDRINADSWENKFGTKKTVSEDDLFCMRDYQGLSRNTGYLLNNGSSLKKENNFAASWSLSDNTIMILLEESKKNYLEDMVNALKSGNLACVQYEPRIFKDRGCCLIDLENAYRPRV